MLGNESRGDSVTLRFVCTAPLPVSIFLDYSVPWSERAVEPFYEDSFWVPLGFPFRSLGSQTGGPLESARESQGAQPEHLQAWEREKRAAGAVSFFCP